MLYVNKPNGFLRDGKKKNGTSLMSHMIKNTTALEKKKLRQDEIKKREYVAKKKLQSEIFFLLWNKHECYLFF